MNITESNSMLSTWDHSSHRQPSGIPIFPQEAKNQKKLTDYMNLCFKCNITDRLQTIYENRRIYVKRNRVTFLIITFSNGKQCVPYVKIKSVTTEFYFWSWVIYIWIPQGCLEMYYIRLYTSHLDPKYFVTFNNKFIVCWPRKCSKKKKQ